MHEANISNIKPPNRISTYVHTHWSLNRASGNEKVDRWVQLRLLLEKIKSTTRPCVCVSAYWMYKMITYKQKQQRQPQCALEHCKQCVTVVLLLRITSKTDNKRVAPHIGLRGVVKFFIISLDCLRAVRRLRVHISLFKFVCILATAIFWTFQAMRWCLLKIMKSNDYRLSFDSYTQPSCNVIEWRAWKPATSFWMMTILARYKVVSKWK